MAAAAAEEFFATVHDRFGAVLATTLSRVEIGGVGDAVLRIAAQLREDRGALRVCLRRRTLHLFGNDVGLCLEDPATSSCIDFVSLEKMVHTPSMWEFRIENGTNLCMELKCGVGGTYNFEDRFWEVLQTEFARETEAAALVVQTLRKLE